jgi:hypothetical protein
MLNNIHDVRRWNLVFVVYGLCLGEPSNKSFLVTEQMAPTLGSISSRKAPRQVHGSLKKSTRPSLITRVFAEPVQCLTVHPTERRRLFRYTILYK